MSLILIYNIFNINIFAIYISFNKEARYLNISFLAELMYEKINISHRESIAKYYCHRHIIRDEYPATSHGQNGRLIFKRQVTRLVKY